MTLPNIILGVVISTLYGALFHLWKDGGLGRFLVYLLASWIGFWIGQAIASYFGITIGKVGSLNILIASIICFLSLGVGHWLSKVEVETKR